MMMMFWFQEENLHEVHLSLEAELESAEQRMRDTLDQLHQGNEKGGRIQY
jgi:hypothetical protein